MKPGNYWASWVVLALAVWELFAAFIWKYGDHFTMTANDVLVGVFLLMFAFWVVATDHVWASWVNLALGVWLIAVGLALEHTLTRAMLNDVVVGLLVIAFAFLAARHGRAAWRRGWPIIERGEGFLTD